MVVVRGAGRRGTAIAAVGALAAALLVPGAVGDAAVPVAAPDHNGWTKLTRQPLPGNTEEPRIDQVSGRQYLVQWIEQTAPNRLTLFSRRLGRDGLPVTGHRTVVGPATQINNHAHFSVGSEITTMTSGLGGGLTLFDLRSVRSLDNGGTWTMDPLPASPGAAPRGVIGVADRAGTAGTAVTAVTAWPSGTAIKHQIGLRTDVRSTPAGTNQTYFVGAAYDAKSTQTWAAWYGIGGQRPGVAVGRLRPDRMSDIRTPPGGATAQAGQQVPIVARSASRGGGLYVAYLPGVFGSAQRRVALWRIGASTPLTVPDRVADNVSAASGDQGRIWLFWTHPGRTDIFFARTDRAGTRLGAVGSVPPPVGMAERLWKLTGNGEDGRLQIVVNAWTRPGGGSAQAHVFSRQILPVLSATVTPRTIPFERGGRITVAVNDAGDVLEGASVKHGSLIRRTNAQGKVTFTIPARTRRGKHTLTITAPGYTKRTVTFTVT